MKPQFIKTEAGEELVVLTRRAYDTLLAQAGDDAAEDRMTALMAEEHLAREPEGEPVPFWFAKLVAEHGSPVTAARKHVGATQAELAAVLGISQGQLSDVERGRPHRFLTADQRARLAAHAGVSEAWLA